MHLGCSDRTIKVWSFDGVAEDVDQDITLKSKAVVAAHDKDINCLAISPIDNLVCSGSEVSIYVLDAIFS